ncbi:hypothetical protein BDZ85DRAFT_296644 [Elsinoe ampelina]|uniref:DNA-directed RNA polymerase subunit n=1 Tax=Elsinoe ampelina TaxID=302913 RepID=A0A6A6G9V3_9PEZI|nr:hypothetical protein BDZ85DRAFT_296644 [Elsinoe ampelina]
MSTDVMDVDTPTPRKHGKSKDKSERSSSKKRRREEQLQEGATDPAVTEETSTPEPSKKRRKSDKTDMNSTNGHAESPQVLTQINRQNAEEELSAARKSKKKRKSDRGESVIELPIEDVAKVQAASKKSEKKKHKSRAEDNTSLQRSKSPSITVLPTPEPDVTITSSSTTYLNKGQVEKHTPFVQETASLLFPLAPSAFNFPLQGLCAEHLSPLLLTYYPPLDGIVLSYSRPRLSNTPETNPPYIRRPAHTYANSQLPDPSPDTSDSDSDASSSLSQPSSISASSRSPSPSPTSSQKKRKTYTGPLVLARTVDEYNTPLAWVTADFLLLRPSRGVWLQGVVQVQNPSWLGLVCWNYFNAGIPRRRLPRGWRWVDAVKAKRAVREARRSIEVADGEGGAQGDDEGVEDGGEGDGDVVEVDKEGVVVDASEGFWVDEAGRKVQGTIEFKLIDFESAPNTERDRGFTSFTGTLLSEKEDEEVDKEEREREKGGRDKGKRVERNNV